MVHTIFWLYTNRLVGEHRQGGVWFIDPWAIPRLFLPYHLAG
jgi:hypothetical protein